MKKKNNLGGNENSNYPSKAIKTNGFSQKWVGSNEIRYR